MYIRGRRLNHRGRLTHTFFGINVYGGGDGGRGGDGDRDRERGGVRDADRTGERGFVFVAEDSFSLAVATSRWLAFLAA